VIPGDLSMSQPLDVRGTWWVYLNTLEEDVKDV
jgi:hypothetical protein